MEHLQDAQRTRRQIAGPSEGRGAEGLEGATMDEATRGIGGGLCACGKPLLARMGSATCGAAACKAANHRWHKLMWWHANRGKPADPPTVNMDGEIPEMDYSGTAPRFAIPEVDTSAMKDTRTGDRVKM